MKTMIIGDLHIGKKHRTTYGDPTIWDNAALKILEELLQKEDPTELILAGDVFDSSEPTALDLMKLISVTTRVPLVYIVAGNHDIPMLKKDTAFSRLEILEYIFLIKANQSYIGENFSIVAWQDTQQLFLEAMKECIHKTPEKGTIIAHCNRKYWDNDNDNSFTDELYNLAAAKDIIIYSGHEHSASISKNFVHLGSVVPQAINQIGKRYYVINNTLKEVPQADKVHLLYEEPINLLEGHCYYVKTSKDVTIKDLKLEEKDINIDIIASFKQAALKEGFTEELIDEFIKA